MGMAVAVSVTVAMPVTLADLGFRELPQAPFSEGFETGGDIGLPGDVDPEPGSLEARKGATAEAAADDGIGRPGKDGVERAAGSVLMASRRVSHSFPLPGVQVEKGEVGGSPEVG
jgi:hypothetical protein